ncbi:hypothetical protein L596_004347 [Steinernema carpocapsae]|uniref:Glycoside hydrolase family 1 protein n=1 Tax=Steinernema carpocapsae TaxID=34508 RepID=A0A4U8UVJ5_STECR|nr:hypothetical protein L596_004347 [Steinernema carpocapsae]
MMNTSMNFSHNVCLYNIARFQITLFHWDFPLELERRGGWRNPDAVGWFCDYARLCFDRFGDLVKTWITFNEIWMSAWMGTVTTAGLSGEALGKTSLAEKAKEDESCSRAIPYLVGHRMLLSHGRAYRIYESEFREKQKGRVGITMSAKWREPASADHPEDAEAARDALCWQFDWIAHPIFSIQGGYPERMWSKLNDLSTKEHRAEYNPILPVFTEEECNIVRGSADFMGLNYYIAYKTRRLTEAERGDERLGWLFRDADYKDTVDPGWEKVSGQQSWLHNTPWGLPRILGYIRDNYNNPQVIITENGCADHPDAPLLQDDARIKYCSDHLKALHQAMTEDSCNVTGYTLWSLLDNFEWTDGFTMKFGLFHVDFNDDGLKRTPKKSVSWYANVVKNNGV